MKENRLFLARLDPTADPRLARGFQILKDRIEQRCRLSVTEAEREAQLVLRISDTLLFEAFRIDEVDGATRVSGGSERGLLYGIGKFLRTSQYFETFLPSAWRGISAPQGSLRGMYFATHFHNWYHVATETEIIRYTEEIALWGANAIMVIFPMINLRGWDDPQAEPAMDMLLTFARAARELGLQFATSINNTQFSGAPASIRATPLPDPTHRRGNSGHPVCPSNPEGLDYILSNARQLFERLSDIGLDLLCHWPYDEGGCGCQDCWPWGARGYLSLSRAVSALAHKKSPHIKVLVSTWTFDTPPAGE